MASSMTEAEKIEMWERLQGIPADKLPLLHRLAEEALADTISSSTVMQARAVTMAGLSGAFALGLLAAAPTLGGAVGWGCAASASAFFIAALLFAFVGRSSDFYGRGFDPSNLCKDEVALDGWVERSTLYSYEGRIRFNCSILTTDSRKLNAGLYVALSAIPAGVIVYALRFIGA